LAPKCEGTPRGSFEYRFSSLKLSLVRRASYESREILIKIPQEIFATKCEDWHDVSANRACVGASNLPGNFLRSDTHKQQHSIMLLAIISRHEAFVLAPDGSLAKEYDDR